MKIRIANVSNDKYWYANKVGEIFTVNSTIKLSDGLNYGVKFDSIEVDLEGYIPCIDCEEVIEHNSQLYRKVDRDPVVGDVILITDSPDIPAGTVSIVKKLCEDYYELDGSLHIIDRINEDVQHYVDGEEDEYSVLELIDQPTPAPQPPAYAEVSELLHEARDYNDVELFRHEGVTYRKIKREAEVGDSIVYEGSERYAEVVSNDCTEIDTKVQTYLSTALSHPHSVLEPVEHPQSDRDLIANLAKELAEVKRELSDYKSTVAHRGQTIEAYAKSLGRRVSALEGGDVVEVIEKAIAELKKREGVSDNLCDHYEKSGIKDLAQFHNGKAHAFLEAQQLLAEAKRNV
jgi:hypothetical protein